MSKDVDVIAAVACAGAGGTVGHATAEKIVAALAAAKASAPPPVPVKKVEPVHIQPPPKKGTTEAPEPVAFVSRTRPSDPEPWHRSTPPKKGK